VKHFKPNPLEGSGHILATKKWYP